MMKYTGRYAPCHAERYVTAKSRLTSVCTQSTSGKRIQAKGFRYAPNSGRFTESACSARKITESAKYAPIATKSQTSGDSAFTYKFRATPNGNRKEKRRGIPRCTS